jgi:hypothetical protein
MLQREGFVVADMSASAPSPSLLRRSSWKAEAIRKGNLKISGPIPITEDMPLNDEEEKKFAENGTLMEVSQPPDTPLQEQHPGSVTPSRPAPSTPAVPEHPMPLRSNLVGEQSQQEEEVRDHPPVRSPHNLQPVNVVQRDSVIPRSALASPTPFRSTPESAAAKATQKKRKSGLRGVFRKMFGKKTAEPEHQQQRDETARRGHSYHSSVSGLCDTRHHISNTILGSRLVKIDASNRDKGIAITSWTADIWFASQRAGAVAPVGPTSAVPNERECTTSKSATRVSYFRRKQARSEPSEGYPPYRAQCSRSSSQPG